METSLVFFLGIGGLGPSLNPSPSSPQLLNTLEDITDYINEDQSDLIILDFSKAFKFLRKDF